MGRRCVLLQNCSSTSFGPLHFLTSSYSYCLPCVAREDGQLSSSCMATYGHIWPQSFPRPTCGVCALSRVVTWKALDGFHAALPRSAGEVHWRLGHGFSRSIWYASMCGCIWSCNVLYVLLNILNCSCLDLTEFKTLQLAKKEQQLTLTTAKGWI